MGGLDFIRSVGIGAIWVWVVVFVGLRSNLCGMTGYHVGVVELFVR